MKKIAIAAVDGLSTALNNTSQAKYVLPSRMEATAATIDAEVDGLLLLGFAALGDGGGGLYKRSATEPTQADKFQSVDGSWWEKTDGSFSPYEPLNDFMGIFWQGVQDMRVRAYRSQDGYEWGVVSDGRMLVKDGDNVTPLYDKDLGLFFWKGYWYISTTNAVNDAEGQWDMYIYRSRDFQNWELFKPTLGATVKFNNTVSTIGASVPTNSIWAPKLFVYDDELYVTIGMRWGPDQTDVNDFAGIRYLRLYYAKCTNLDTLTFGEPVPHGIDYTEARIDSRIYEMGANSWWLLCKNDITGDTEIWKSDNPFNFPNPPQVIDFGDKAEGQGLSRTYYPNGDVGLKVWVDYHNKGLYLATESLDNGATWGTPVPQRFPHCVRHGTVLNLMDLPQPDRNVARKSFHTFVDQSVNQAGPEIQYERDLGSGAVTLNPVDRVLYYVNGSNLATITIEERQANSFFLAVKTGDPAAGIIINNNNWFPAQGIALGFGETSDIIVEVRLNILDGQYYVVGPIKRPCQFRAYIPSDVNITKGTLSGPLSFSVEDFDIGLNYNNSTYRVVVPANKRVRLSAMIMVSGVDNEAEVTLRILRNGGAVVAQKVMRTSGTNTLSADISTVVSGNGSDYYDVRVLVGGTGNAVINGSTSNCFFEAI